MNHYTLVETWNGRYELYLHPVVQGQIPSLAFRSNGAGQVFVDRYMRLIAEKKLDEAAAYADGFIQGWSYVMEGTQS